MSLALYPSLFFTVVQLVITAYFLMGGLPLLVLKHDTALDANFIRGFFNFYYKLATWTAAAAAVSYALWGRLTFALGACAIVLVIGWLRRIFIPAMEQVGTHIQTGDAHAIQRFRKVHSAALLVNLVQLAVIVWSITKIPF